MNGKKTSLADLRVGVLVLAAVAILIIFILSVAGDLSLFGSRLKLTTRLSAADGLKPGDEVWLAGKLVGKVTDVTFIPQIPTNSDQKSVIINMALDAKEVDGRIRTDSVAILGQQGFLGERLIDITPGTTKGDPIHNGAEVPSSDQANLSQVFQGANDLLVEFNSVAKQLQGVMDNVNKGQGTIGRLLHDDSIYVNLNRTVLDAQDTVKQLRSGNGTLGKLLNDPKLYDNLKGTTDSLQAMMADLRAGKGTAGKLLNDDQFYNRANETISKVNDAADKLDKITAQIQSGQGTIGKLIKDDKLHTDLSATVASLRNISDQLEKGQGTAGMILHDDRLYNNLNQTSSEIVKLLYDFRQNPKKFLSIKLNIF
ncbi:MAG TPA: MlaD family protein [Blastocatellia bacterium]|nr:MlaD family protein [Blastocatellia bacterium]